MRIKFFVIVVVLMVAAVTLTGLILAGSPLAVRERRFDQQRVNDLRAISVVVDEYYARTGHLPATLDDLSKPKVVRFYYLPSIVDPQTLQPYEYAVSGKSGYRLCATFAQATKQQGADSANEMMDFAYPEKRGWEHSAGRACFELLAPPKKSE